MVFTQIIFSMRQVGCRIEQYNRINHKFKETFIMRKLELKVETIGVPTLNGYSESEKTVFYTTLLARIQQLAKGGK